MILLIEYTYTLRRLLDIQSIDDYFDFKPIYWFRLSYQPSQCEFFNRHRNTSVSSKPEKLLKQLFLCFAYIFATRHIFVII